jgi:hypothetical protein
MTFKIGRLVGGENSVVLRTCDRMDSEFSASMHEVR